MPISKAKKKEIYSELGKKIKDSSSVVFVNFHGLTVADSSKMRRDLKGKGVGYTVAKKTIAKKALSESGFGGEIPELVGELAIAYGKDATDAAREVYSFQKKLDGKISILGGVFEGKFAGKEKMLEIASIPSMNVLRAQFVNIINSPIQGFVMALDQIAKKKTV